MILELMHLKLISLSCYQMCTVFYQTRPDRCLVLKRLRFKTDLSRYCMMADPPREGFSLFVVSSACIHFSAGLVSSTLMLGQ